MGYSVFYEFNEHPGMGYEFPSDENGVIDRDDLCDDSKASLARCETGIVDGEPVTRRLMQDEGWDAIEVDVGAPPRRPGDWWETSDWSK